jgi:hypothetical protein
VVAGAYHAVAIVGGSVSPAILQRLQTQVAATKATLESGDPALIGALTREALLGDLFYAGTLGYFAQYTALAHVMSLAADGHHALMPSVGTYGYVPEVRKLFGLPTAIEPGGIQMDLDAVNGVSDPSDGDSTKRRNLVFQTGILSSALESAVPEQMFVTPDHPGEAISTVKALAKANAAGQRIYHITAANEAAVLPNLHLAPEVITEIQAAIHAGKEVITHTDPVSVPGWGGAGYIIFDPETGEGAYKIAGGLSGGWMELLDIFSTIIDIGFTKYVVVGKLGGLADQALDALGRWSALFSYAFGFVDIALKCSGDPAAMQAAFSVYTLLTVASMALGAVVPGGFLVALVAGVVIGQAVSYLKGLLLDKLNCAAYRGRRCLSVRYAIV